MCCKTHGEAKEKKLSSWVNHLDVAKNRERFSRRPIPWPNPQEPFWLDQRSRGKNTQPQKHRFGLAQEPVGGDHGFVGVGQIESGL